MNLLRSRMLYIFLVVFVDLLSFGLILPLIPYFVEDYGGSATLVGLIVATYAAAQFVGAPLLGRLSDRFGRRPILLLSIGGTSLGLAALGLAEPLGTALSSFVLEDPSAAELAALRNGTILGLMFLSRGLTGLAGGNLTVAQAYVADITDHADRARGMGLLGAAFGLGFILGPAIGGLLSRWGYGAPAFAAAGLSAVNLIGVVLFLPESLSQERRAELATQARLPLISARVMLSELSKPRVGPLMTIRLSYAVAAALFQTMLTLWSKERLGLTTQDTAWVLAYVGALSVIVQAGLIGRLTRCFGEARLIVHTVAVLAVSLLAWAFTPSVILLLAVLVPLAFGTGVLNTVINSAISRMVPPHEVGGALGTSGAFESLSRVISPIVGGWLLGAAGTWAPGLLAAVLMAAVTVYARRTLIPEPAPTDA